METSTPLQPLPELTDSPILNDISQYCINLNVDESHVKSVIKQNGIDDIDSFEPIDLKKGPDFNEYQFNEYVPPAEITDIPLYVNPDDYGESDLPKAIS